MKFGTAFNKEDALKASSLKAPMGTMMKRNK